MKIACLPENEVERIKALRRYDVLDTPAEAEFDGIAELAARLCGTPIAAISLVDERRLWFKAATAAMGEIPRDVAFCAHAILRDEPMVVRDAAQDERFVDNPLVAGPPHIRFYAGIRLVTPDGYPLGTLCVIDQVPRDLEAEQLTALQTLVRQIMALLELRLVRRSLQHRVADWQRTESMLKLSAALAQTAEAVTLTDLEANYTYINPAFSRLFGYRPEEVLGRSVGMLMPDEAVSGRTAQQTIHEAQAQGFFTGEVIRRARDGRLIPILLRVSLLRDEYGNAAGYVGTMSDLTEVKRVEHALRDSEQRLRDIFEHAPLGIVTLSLDGAFLSVNPAFCEIVGYRAEELHGMPFCDITHPDDVEVSHANISRLLAGGSNTYWVEKRYLHKSGRLVWARVNTSLQRDATGSPRHLICQIENVSARKQAEILAGEREQFLGALFESALDAVVIMDDKGLITGWNRRAETTFGWRREDALGRALHETIMPPRYRVAHQHGLRHFLQSGEGAVLDTRIEIVALHRDGHEFPVELTVSPIKTARGYEFSSFIRDITQRKAVEERLQLAALIYQHAAEAMLVTDADNNIIAINPAFTRVTGYAVQEVLGRNPRVLSSGRQGLSFYRDMWHTLQQTGRWQGEIWNRRKDGEVYAEWLTISVIRNEDGTVDRHVALFSDITEKKRFEEQILIHANFDPLTRLPNRRLFHDRLEQEMRKTDRGASSMALLFIDLDRFKEVNDTLGHHVGDALLLETASRIGSCVRESDTVARLGGDEFTVILSGITDPRRVERVSEAIIEALGKPFVLGQEAIYVSASIGITLYPDDADNVTSLLRNADQAMYAAKNQGRNRFFYFTHSMQQATLERHHLISELRGALAANQFEVYFQPIVEMASGRIAKAEALLRWRHPQRGLVSPAEFIPLAEETGMIHSIGDWVFRQSALYARLWSERFGQPIQVSVNMSPVQFLSGVDHRAWLDYLDELGLPGEYIVIEITEGLLLHANAGVAEQLGMFRAAGMQIAIDDFGTGYSAFSYLKKFEIDYLKIDRTFTEALASSESDLALSEAIIVMARKLGLQVIAEGVETEAQKQLLTGMGCCIGQGYLFSRPVPAGEFEALLQSNFEVLS